jgi:hypothetical protein
MSTKRTTAVLVVLDCPECARPEMFEQPPCDDGHDPCPELICVTCTTAVVLGGPSAPVVPVEVPLARTA